MLVCPSCLRLCRADDLLKIDEFLFCPLCKKETERNEDLVCNNCNHRDSSFPIVKRTCYLIIWECPKCHSNDVLDPDCE